MGHGHCDTQTHTRRRTQTQRRRRRRRSRCATYRVHDRVDGQTKLTSLALSTTTDNKGGERPIDEMHRPNATVIKRRANAGMTHFRSVDGATNSQNTGQPRKPSVVFFGNSYSVNARQKNPRVSQYSQVGGCKLLRRRRQRVVAAAAAAAAVAVAAAAAAAVAEVSKRKKKNGNATSRSCVRRCGRVLAG